MTYTTNYNLKKPADTDFYNVADFNANADTIDTQLKTLSTTTSGLDTNKADKAALPKVSSITMLKGWFSSSSTYPGYSYKYECAMTDLTANDSIDINLDMASQKIAQDCGLSSVVICSAGKFTVYSKKIPTADLTGTKIVTKGGV